MPDTTQQLTLGAIIATLLLIIKFVNFKRGGNAPPGKHVESAGEKSPDFWMEYNKTVISEALRMAILPILEAQLVILREIQNMQSRDLERMLALGFKVDELKGDTTKLRESVHQLRDKIQEIVVVPRLSSS